jgi:hypothetical protein
VIKHARGQHRFHHHPTTNRGRRKVRPRLGVLSSNDSGSTCRVSELERFQDLQVKLVVAGFDTTLKARREGDEAVVSLTVALHHEQTPELMAKLTEIIGGHGFAFTAENETIEITTLDA